MINKDQYKVQKEPFYQAQGNEVVAVRGGLCGASAGDGQRPDRLRQIALC